MVGAIAVGTATGTAPPSSITADRTTGMLPGTAAITVRVRFGEYNSATDLCAWRSSGTRSAAGYNPSTGTYARGASASNAYGSAGAAQAYNPRTGASASTVQGSNAYGSAGASTVSKNGNTAYSQHQTNANGTTGQVQTTNGGSAYGASGKNGNSASVAQTANGNKYATANGNTYKNTGSGWSGKFEQYSEIQLEPSCIGAEFCCRKGLGWAGEEQRIIGLGRRRRWRMAIPLGECSRSVKAWAVVEAGAAAEAEAEADRRR